MGDHLTYLSSHQDAILGDLREFVTRESPSTDKALLDAYARFLREYASTVGTPAIELLEVAERGGNHVRIRWEGKRQEQPIVMLAHYDTVWPAGTIEEIPFSVRGGVAHGPGVFDMKTGLLQGFWAIRSLLANGGLQRPIVYLCTSDEEIGSQTSRALIEEAARKARAVFVLEPSVGEQGAYKTSRKGVAEFSVEIQGLAAHAGIDPFSGVSAIEELAHVVLDLQALTDRETGTTVSVGVVGGGTRTNVIPDRAFAKVDVRATTVSEMDRISRAIRGLRSHNPKAHVQVVEGGSRPPMERTPQIAALFERAQELARPLGIVLDEAFVGGGSDGNFCAALGVPVLDGMGAVGGGAHARSEHARVDEIPRRTALLAALLEAI